jgi:hypothetical protein
MLLSWWPPVSPPAHPCRSDDLVRGGRARASHIRVRRWARRDARPRPCTVRSRPQPRVGVTALVTARRALGSECGIRAIVVRGGSPQVPCRLTLWADSDKRSRRCRLASPAEHATHPEPRSVCLAPLVLGGGARRVGSDSDLRPSARPRWKEARRVSSDFNEWGNASPGSGARPALSAPPDNRTFACCSPGIVRGFMSRGTRLSRRPTRPGPVSAPAAAGCRRRRPP